MYDCEIQWCYKKTSHFLCPKHEIKANRDDIKTVVCINCNCIIALESRKMGEDKVRFTNGGECFKCKPKLKEEEWYYQKN